MVQPALPNLKLACFWLPRYLESSVTLPHLSPANAYCCGKGGVLLIEGSKGLDGSR